MSRLASPFRRARRTSTRRVLLVYCHPSPTSFVASVRDRALVGLGAGGADVRTIDLYAEGFEPTFSDTERRVHLEPGVHPSIQRHADDLAWCDTLVLVYPTWWAGQPAMLKGWFDRVWVCGVAWELPVGANRLKPLLRNVRRIAAITTHGSPKHINALEGEGGKRTVSRSLRAMCHPLCRTTWLALYDIDRCPDLKRNDFLATVETRMRSLVS